MDAILQQLASLIIKAVPTLLLFLILHYYLKYMFFRPLGRVLEERHRATGGARQAAEKSLSLADEKAAEYERALAAVKAEVYTEQEKLRKSWQQEREERIRLAREGAGLEVAKARETLAADTQVLRQQLEAEAEALAAQIAEAVLQRRVA